MRQTPTMETGGTSYTLPLKSAQIWLRRRSAFGSRCFTSIGKLGARRRSSPHILEGSGHGSHILDDKAPLAFAKHILPVVAHIIDETAVESEEYLDSDRTWGHRDYRSDHLSLHDALFQHLARWLEALAVTSPPELDSLLTSVKQRPQNSVAYFAYGPGQPTLSFTPTPSLITCFQIRGG